MSGNIDAPITGGCHCRDIRYEARGTVYRQTHCHCTICRGFGGTLMSWITLDQSRFSFTSGSPKRYRSSPAGRRNFCGHCGAHLTFQHRDDHETIDIAIGTLDDSSAFAPNNQIWLSESLPCIFEIENLPSSPQDGDMGHNGIL